jgi:hypothetical protein
MTMSTAEDIEKPAAEFIGVAGVERQECADSLAPSERTKSQNLAHPRGNKKKRVTGIFCRSPSNLPKQAESALFLAGLQIFQQMMNEVADIALREREGIAAHRLFANGAIGQMLG